MLNKLRAAAAAAVIGSGLTAATVTRADAAAADTPPAPLHPNVLLILADDMGYSDLGCYGSEIHTPNVDALAKDGIRFSSFYNQARCCPTRAALLTGMYPHEVGIGAMIDDYAKKQREAANSPAYQDHLDPASPTIAELLRTAGYETFMVGKWHMGRRPAEWPVKRGFDHSFVQINGAMNYYGGRSGNQPRDPMAIDDKPWEPPHDGFYSTDAFGDHAVQYLKDAAAHRDKPFFLYLAFNAPHWPLQAPEDEVAKYKGVYDKGWDAIREARLARMKELGVVPADQTMSPPDHGKQKPWDQLTDAARKEWARRMEVYAAQITREDENVGRVIATLKEQGLDKDTVVLFMSDNGGAAEDPNRSAPGAEIGSRDSFRGYARPWATVSNTPWRLHKTTAYEGGISSPMIVHWSQIPEEKHGTWLRAVSHVTDVLPTALSLAGATYPATAPHKPEGQDVTALWHGQDNTTDRTLCWEHEGNRAIRKGHWKLVNLGTTEQWELYDLATDRTESHDLATERPEVAKDLANDWNAWAKRCGVQRWHDIQEKIQSAEAK